MIDWKDSQLSAEEIVALAVMEDQLLDRAICLAVSHTFKPTNLPSIANPLLLPLPRLLS